MSILSTTQACSGCRGASDAQHYGTALTELNGVSVPFRLVNNLLLDILDRLEKTDDASILKFKKRILAPDPAGEGFVRVD
jgi:hypothetical protein